MTFVLSWASNVLIEGWNSAAILPQMLVNCGLGRHSSIVHIAGSATENTWQVQVTHFIWSNPSLRLHSDFLPVVCQVCRSYQSFVKSKQTGDSGGPITFICHGKVNGTLCKAMLKFSRPPTLVPMAQPPVDNWLVEDIEF